MAGTSKGGPYRIGIDTGGTFTDIVAVDTGSGTVSVTKVSSTPANPAGAAPANPAVDPRRARGG